MASNRFKGNKPTIDFDDPVVLTSVPAEVEQEVVPVKEKVESQTVEVVDVKDILADGENAKPRGKTYSIYFEADVMAAIDKLAKQSKLPRSKVINKLLRTMLFKG